ncbi:MAG: hypothetical protein V7661_17620 [Sulfitobacter sp.]
MSWRRKAVYLILIAPLHHLALILASIPAAFVLPSNLLVQILLITPVFAAGVWWGIPKFQRLIGFPSTIDGIASLRASSVLGAIGTNGLAIMAVFSGYATPIEALVLGALALIALHAWLIRTL